MLTEEPSVDFPKEIEVFDSATGGKGVGPTRGATIAACTILGKYPGPVSWETPEETKRITEESEYVFSHGPYYTPYPHKNPYYLVWNPSPNSPEWDASIMQYINTCHPRLQHEWTTRNCVWGLYINTSEAFSVVPTELPKASLYVLTIKDVTCSSTARNRREFLLDYHWHLAYTHGQICGDLSCANCYECMLRFMNVWKKHLKGQK